MNHASSENSTEQMSGKGVVIMGVSSTGKSSVGAAVAKILKAKFIDGDDLHPKANILKMSNREPLNDDDRAPWLERIRDAVFSLERKGELGIVVCSALKKKYRDCIRDGNHHVSFLFLQGEFDLVRERMETRQNHFMPVQLLQSQFETLEVPDQEETDVIFIDINAEFDEVVTRCVDRLVLLTE